MTKKILLISSFVLLAGLVIFPLTAQAETRFNMMAADIELLKMKNETQGTVSWQDPISANSGDYIRFDVYYHCGTTDSNIPTQQAQNTIVRINFPTTEQNSITTTALVSANNVTSANDNGIINVSTAQKLVFDNITTWYRDNNQTVSNITVSQGAGYVEVNLGSIDCDTIDCYTEAGYVVFRGRLTTSSGPTVDLKVNGSDGPITVNYNTAATLSWTSSNASSCYATDTAWQGYKSLSGSETTGNLLSSKTYIIACSGAGGSASDSVTVQVANQQQTLYASLETIPNTGNAPLNGVDLRATATGTATGLITYRFDCTSDGVWDQTFSSISENPKTVVDACNYQNIGTYIAKVRIERGTASAAEATATVIVGSAGTQDLSVNKLGRNLSDNTAYGEVTTSDPGEVIEFHIFITATGNSILNDVIVKDTLPANMSYLGSLKIDDVSFVGGNILTGLNIGTLNPQQTKKITFQALVAQAANFAFGTTNLVNTVSVYNSSVSRTDTASVNVVRTEVKGATDVPTGVLDSAKIALITSAMATILLTYFMLLRFYVGKKAYALGVNEVVSSAKEKIADLMPKEPSEKAEQRLNKIIEEIRNREKNS